MLQVGREGNKNMRARAGRGWHGTVYERPTAPYATREECRVLILGREDCAAPLEGLEIARQRERDERAALGVGGVGDGPAPKLRQVNDACVLDAPQLFWKILRV